MLLTRANMKGGKPLKGFPLQEEGGVLGYKLGYCLGCNEPILVRTIEAKEILTHFVIGEYEHKKLLQKLKPKITWRQLIIKSLGGRFEPVDNN